MTSNVFILLFSTLHFRLILYKPVKIIHGSSRYFGGAALQELTCNFAINRFLKGGAEQCVRCLAGKVCSNNSLLQRLLFWFKTQMQPSVLFFT